MTVDEPVRPRTTRHVRRDPSLARADEIVTGPVSDWATDFSHLEPEYAADAPEVWDDLRGRCPIAHTDRFGGGWLPTRYEDVAAIAYDTEHFTSRAIIVSNFRPPLDIAPIGGVAADLVGPAVPPRRAQAAAAGVHRRPPSSKQEAATRAFCHSLIDGFAGPRRRRRRGRVRPAHPDAGHRRHARLPARGRRRSSAVRRERPRGRQPAARGAHRAHARSCSSTSSTQIRDHIANPRDDLTTYLLDAELDGQQARPVARRRHDRAAAHRRHRHHLERHRRLAVAPGRRTPRTASGWSPSPSCCRPRWRSSCAPTRR